VKVSGSSFTVSANASAHRYRLFASTNRKHLAADKIARAHKSTLTKTPRLTLSKLRYTTKPYYYRVQALNGSKRRFSASVGTVTLQPAAPTNVAITTSDTSGMSLTWSSGTATGFSITQATDPAMTQDVHTYTTVNQDQQFTPYGLDQGTTYYFTVAALNGTTASDPSSVVSAMSQSDEQPVSVMSYNLLEITADGRSEGGNTVAPWSERRVAQANLITGASPDVVAIQEGGSWVGAVKGPRQVDDLVSQLGGAYSLAATEIPPDQPHYFRTGCYILYKNADYTPVGAGDHWSLGDSRWAAYQVLQNKTTGAKFLFVAPHLAVDKIGGTDQSREDEAKSMVAQATAYAATLGVPIVYAGDFNSDPSKGHEFNGPSDYMLSQGIDDSFDAAQTRSHEQYNSANGYLTTAPTNGLRIDYIMAPPGVAVKSWNLLLNLSHGKFVGVIPSDHNPIVANLMIPYQATS
jgi:endonuclease/exonuclease/phosphatase family metal-dependent hydrolase